MSLQVCPTLTANPYGRLAGAHIPADIYARWLRLMLGDENVLFVCGTDDHGSTSEIAAKKANTTNQEFIAKIHNMQKKTLDDYHISLDTYSGTSQQPTSMFLKEFAQDMLAKIQSNKMLYKKTTKQWFDPELNIFLPDRYVFGDCPNPNCDNSKAYSEECDVCGMQYEPQELKNPKSSLSSASPLLKDTDHLWLDMWQVSDQIKQWIQSRQKVWKKNVLTETLTTVSPCLTFSKEHEEFLNKPKKLLPSIKAGTLQER